MSIITVEITDNADEVNLFINSTPGGAAGDFPYSKVSEVAYGGISVGETVGNTVVAALNQMLSLPFDNMVYSFTIDAGTSEKGTTVIPKGVWSYTNNDDTVTLINLLQDNAIIATPSLTPTSGNQDFNSVVWNDTQAQRTCKIEITSDNAGVQSTSRVVNFYAPSYSGVLDAADIGSEAAIKGLTKNIWTDASQRVISFSPVLQRFVYVYPKSYGAISAIIDQNNFNVTNGFTETEITFTLDDGVTTELMNAVTLDSDTTQTNFELTFILE